MIRTQAKIDKFDLKNSNTRADIWSWPRLDPDMVNILDLHKTPRLIWARSSGRMIAVPPVEFLTF